MAYDGLVNYSIIQEIKDKLINGKIDKIFEPNFDEIILGIYSDGNKFFFKFNVNSMYYRASLTKNIAPNPVQAPIFCMTLRKYLQNTHITNIYSHNLERIIFIEFEGFNKSKDFSTKKLIIELMGKYSNIILTDFNNIIIDSLKHFSIKSGSHRNIFAGADYILPNADKLDFFEIKDSDEFFNVIVNNSKKLNSNSFVKIISSTFIGISNKTIRAFEGFLNITDDLDFKNSSLIFNYIHNIINYNKSVFVKSIEKDYSLYFDSTRTKENFNINFFLDDFYYSKEKTNTFITYRDYLLKLILVKLKKLNSKLNIINDKLNECADSEKYKLYGELITSNLYKINDYNQNEITLENYYDNNNLITIPLDGSINPSSNAKVFFKKYKKLKNAREYVDKQKKNIIENIDYLESIVYEINSAISISDLDSVYRELQENSLISSHSKKSNKINKRKINKDISIQDCIKCEVDGFTVLIGKNNKQNDYLSTKIASKDDLWLHVKDFHGSHVIIKTNGKTLHQNTINKCALLAKEHSKAKDSNNITVDYTLAQYVRKPSGSKPGMVIYTHEQSVTVK